MKYFKTQTSRTAKRHEINERNFNLYTENKPPFQQAGDDGTIRYYGICPSCQNPAQLIGLYKQIKRSPYGQHTGKDIDGFPKWDYYKYQHCPYAKSADKKAIDPDERGIITEDTVELYNLLKTQFDRIVYIIRQDFEIKCSENFWRKSITQFCSSEGYCYPWLTESNLPYVFAFFGLQQQNPYKQQIKAGSDLYAALCKHPKITFDSTESEKYPRLVGRKAGFVNLYFRLTDHKQMAKDGDELKESIKFCVDDRDDGKVIFEKRIYFDETHFLNLINKDGNEDKRDKRLLDIANELMIGIE